MWHKAIVFIVVWQLASAGPQYARCPAQCKCDQPVVECDNLELKKFGTKVYNLKVVNPEQPVALTANIFANMGISDVHTIFIESARITEVHEHAFAGLESLRSLSLVNCEISQFDLQAIRFPASLEKLSFSGTPIKKFDLRLGSLVELDLTNTNITALGPDMFAGVPKLTFLSVANNKIQAIHDAALASLTDLVDINLSGNKLVAVPKNLFVKNADLVSADLSHNALSVVDMHFPAMLEKLVLHHCALRDFENVKLETLSYLDLSHNKLKYLKPTALMYLSALEYVDLSFNNLQMLDGDVFMHNPNLRKIVLDENSIDRLPKFVSTEKFATSLFSCTNCDTVIEDDTFENMPLLVTLQLAGNQIETLGASLQHLQALTQLDVSDNEIVNISTSAFKHNPALRTVNLSMNSLSEIDPACFAANKVLRELDLSANQLATIWKQITSQTLPSVLEINASNNHMKRILVEDLQVTPNIQILNISHNDINCDEQMEVAINWLETNKVLPGKMLTKMPLLNSNVAEDVSLNSVWLCEHRTILDCDYDSSEGADYDDVITVASQRGAAEVEGSVEPGIAGMLLKPSRNQYFWPILVFFVTAVIVLLVAANVILFVLRQRGSIAHARPITMPRVKIIPMLHQSKIKKHSGTVYKPLSEENIHSSRIDVPSTNLL